jgi:ribulose-phosphate 3-epimerase
MMKIAPSLLSADFSKLDEQVRTLENCGADMLHVDVMDGHFVPNITIGPVVIRAIRNCTKLPFDVHLMIEHPDRFIKSFADAGSNIITVHAEAEHNIDKTIKLIRECNVNVGVAVNPATPLAKIKNLMDKIDMLLIMTVNPGFAGQKFIHDVVPKIKDARNIIDSEGLDIDLEVDGGINPETGKIAVDAGANVLVAGSFIFKGDIKENIDVLKRL